VFPLLVEFQYVHWVVAGLPRRFPDWPGISVLSDQTF
jgi:hypothetical protein